MRCNCRQCGKMLNGLPPQWCARCKDDLNRLAMLRAYVKQKVTGMCASCEGQKATRDEGFGWYICEMCYYDDLKESEIDGRED